MNTSISLRNTFWFAFIILVGIMAFDKLRAQDSASVFKLLKTDTAHSTVDLEDIMSGGPPPQGIPALGFKDSFSGTPANSTQPEFESIGDTENRMADNDPVVVVERNGVAHAYPLAILTWHEIANDEIGGIPVAVTYCPLCNTALAFDRRIQLSPEQQAMVLEQNPEARFHEQDEKSFLEVTFGTSGSVYQSNLLMFDSQTHTLWSQAVGEAVVGTLAGTQLRPIAAQLVGFKSFRDSFPIGLVLSDETGLGRDYGRNPYVNYDEPSSTPFLFRDTLDDRLPPKTRVVGFIVSGKAVAVPYPHLIKNRTAHVDESVVVFWTPGATSALDQANISDSDDAGQTGAFLVSVDGKQLTFTPENDHFIDTQAGSHWNILGIAIDGPLLGSRLKPVIHDNALWFAWAAFHPETEIHDE